MAGLEESPVQAADANGGPPEIDAEEVKLEHDSDISEIPDDISEPPPLVSSRDHSPVDSHLSEEEEDEEEEEESILLEGGAEALPDGDTAARLTQALDELGARQDAKGERTVNTSHTTHIILVPVIDKLHLQLLQANRSPAQLLLPLLHPLPQLCRKPLSKKILAALGRRRLTAPAQTPRHQLLLLPRTVSQLATLRLAVVPEKLSRPLLDDKLKAPARLRGRASAASPSTSQGTPA